MKKHRNKTHLTDTTTSFHHRHFSTHLTFSTQITLNHYTSHSKQNMHASLQSLHSHPKQKSNHSYSSKLTIQIFKNNMILYACTNEKYLIPISVPILHLKTESYPTLQFCVDEGGCDGVILYIGECKYI